MKDNSQKSEKPGDRREEPGHENEPQEPSMSRRDVLKRGAYAAPAIMAIGSLPSFGSNGSPGGGGNDGSGDAGGDDDNSGSGSTSSRSQRKGGRGGGGGWMPGFLKWLFS